MTTQQNFEGMSAKQVLALIQDNQADKGAALAYAQAKHDYLSEKGKAFRANLWFEVIKLCEGLEPSIDQSAMSCYWQGNAKQREAVKRFREYIDRREAKAIMAGMQRRKISGATEYRHAVKNVPLGINLNAPMPRECFK
jgi:hypothetical protein